MLSSSGRRGRRRPSDDDVFLAAVAEEQGFKGREQRHVEGRAEGLADGAEFFGELVRDDEASISPRWLMMGGRGGSVGRRSSGSSPVSCWRQ